MRVLGLDIGEKRLGVAVSDPTLTVASPLVVLDAKSELGDGRELKRIIDDYDVELLVVGLPRSMDGSEGPQAQRVRRAAERLSGILGVPVVYADERLSSVEAGRAMSEAGLSDRAKRGSVDMVAAALFLQSHLDARAKASTPEDE